MQARFFAFEVSTFHVSQSQGEAMSYDNLNRWEKPSGYAGESWYGYYSAGELMRNARGGGIVSRSAMHPVLS